jgi:hypothetical protein
MRILTAEGPTWLVSGHNGENAVSAGPNAGRSVAPGPFASGGGGDAEAPGKRYHNAGRTP